MLLKIHDLFKISLDVYEIHPTRVWLQNTKHVRSYGTSNFIFSFLCTKVTFLKTKRCAIFLLLKILLQKNFHKFSIMIQKSHAKMANFRSSLQRFLSWWKWLFYKVKCKKVEFHCKALYTITFESVQIQSKDHRKCIVVLN